MNPTFDTLERLANAMRELYRGTPRATQWFVGVRQYACGSAPLWEAWTGSEQLASHSPAELLRLVKLAYGLSPDEAP